MKEKDAAKSSKGILSDLKKETDVNSSLPDKLHDELSKDSLSEALAKAIKTMLKKDEKF